MNVKVRITSKLVVLAALLASCRPAAEIGPLELESTLEHRRPDGTLYSASTQSLLRTHSRLESAHHLTLIADGSRRVELRLGTQGSDALMQIHNLEIADLLPRLHYRPTSPPDAFDAFNLMMAEYSRNGLSVPRGSPGDSMAHFRTWLSDTVSWKLAGDYDFEPNPDYRPVRVGVTNNCLRPGLWELNAVDRTGEIYHSWFDMPLDYYYRQVAAANRAAPDFVRDALAWRDERVAIHLDRLRSVEDDLGEVAIVSENKEVGFSSQTSRRKIERSFALIDSGGRLSPPRELRDLQTHPVAMASFVEPGIYSSKVGDRSRFDFSFLADPVSARVARVAPKTGYGLPSAGHPASEPRLDYIEITVELRSGETLVIGNLPLELLVHREDFRIHGFGVGIVSAQEPAERRRLLYERGPRPSFAYLAERRDEVLEAVNSHLRGIEQIFIRSHPGAQTPHWEVILTSYERIVDLVCYRIAMPPALADLQTRHAAEYVPPIYFTYRDDNTR